MTRPKAEYDWVTQLIGLGQNDCRVARTTGIPRTTIRDWRRGLGHNALRSPLDRDRRCVASHSIEELPSKEYSYLLGMYLGDGYIASHSRGVYRLRISCDAHYTGIIEECRTAMEAVMPGQRALVQQRPPMQCVEVSMYSKHWPCFFPQHGVGRKHERRIYLADWQERLVISHTESFVRALIQSDGCRVVANDRGVASVRYHFSNRSEDIKVLFCDALDRLDIPWTRPSDRDIAIYRKTATARLDEFVGPKR